MTEFPKNPQHLTPYRNFRFKVKWDDNYVAGVSHVSGLQRQTQVIQHREGGDPSVIHLTPGQTSYAPITLSRGVSYDPAFETWANKVYDFKNSQDKAGENTSLGDFRKNISIEVFNEAGQKVLAYNVVNAWVSEFNALPELDAMGNAIVIESMTIQNEGWSRDQAVTEQKEPDFSDPSS
ncbi:MAG: phage tail protein [Sulfitobacter sp.]